LGAKDLSVGDWVLIKSTNKRGMIDKLEEDRAYVMFVDGSREWHPMNALFKLVETISPARPRSS